MSSRLELFAACLAAVMVFIGLVAPLPVVLVGLAVVVVGLASRMRGTRAGSRSAVQNRR